MSRRALKGGALCLTLQTVLQHLFRMVGSYRTSQGVRLKPAFLQDDGSHLQMQETDSVSYPSLAVCCGRSYFPHCLLSALTWFSCHVNGLFRTGGAGDAEEMCLPRGSDELQVILLALSIDVDSVDGTESLNK